MNAEEVLKARAAALARREDTLVERGLPLTVFARGGLLFGIRVEEVAGAGTLRQLTAVPGAPPWIAGALFHRGEVLTLVDLPAFWGLPLKGISDLPTYIVISDGASRIGIPVEEVRGVIEVSGALTPWRGAPRAGVAEVAHLADAPVQVLRANALLSDSRLLG